MRSVPTATIAFHNADAPILRLPDDLLDAVCQQFLKTPPFANDLLSLTLICSRISAAAKRALYFDPTLSLSRDGNSPDSAVRDWERFQALGRRLSDDPLLAQHARRFDRLGQITYAKAESLEWNWSLLHDLDVVRLLKACPNVTSITVTPYIGRQDVGKPFQWLRTLHKRKALQRIVIKSAAFGMGALVLPFFEYVPMPAGASIVLENFYWISLHLVGRQYTGGLTTTRLTLLNCDLMNLNDWSDVQFICPNLEHLRLRITTLPSALPTTVLPSTLRTLDVGTGIPEECEDPGLRPQSTSTANAEVFVRSLPHLPNLVRLCIKFGDFWIKDFAMLAQRFPVLEELLLWQAVWKDEDVCAGNGDEAFLRLVSTFRHLRHVDLGCAPIPRQDDFYELCREYCMLNRIQLLLTPVTAGPDSAEEIVIFGRMSDSPFVLTGLLQSVGATGSASSVLHRFTSASSLSSRLTSRLARRTAS